jgi:hypothetical protein
MGFAWFRLKECYAQSPAPNLAWSVHADELRSASDCLLPCQPLKKDIGSHGTKINDSYLFRLM